VVQPRKRRPYQAAAAAAGLLKFRTNTLDSWSGIDQDALQVGQLAQTIRELGAERQAIHIQGSQAVEVHRCILVHTHPAWRAAPKVVKNTQLLQVGRWAELIECRLNPLAVLLRHLTQVAVATPQNQ